MFFMKEFIKRLLIFFYENYIFCPLYATMELKFGNKMAKNGKKMPENCEILNFGPRKSRKEKLFLDKILIIVLI